MRRIIGVQIEGFQVKNEVFVLFSMDLSFNCDDDDDDRATRSLSF